MWVRRIPTLSEALRRIHHCLNRIGIQVVVDRQTFGDDSLPWSGFNPGWRLCRCTTASAEVAMDEDLDKMARNELIAEVKKLRQGIRQHRDCSGHELCWHHPTLWGLLPEKTDPVPAVPEWPQFLRGCIAYRQSLDEQAASAPRTREDFQAP
jgi:hypothetical protein